MNGGATPRADLLRRHALNFYEEFETSLLPGGSEGNEAGDAPAQIEDGKQQRQDHVGKKMDQQSLTASPDFFHGGEAEKLPVGHQTDQ
jgi:hypothetical protein